MSLGPASSGSPVFPQSPGEAADRAVASPGARGRRATWPAVLVCTVLLIAGLVANMIGQGSHSAGSVPVPDTERPTSNAILFLVDDMPDFSCAEAKLYLPRSSHWLLDQGTCYESATTSTPVCCPARAQVQTGQLAHNNRVVSQLAARNLDTRNTIQHDLGLIGVDTYGIGKNLNGVDASEYHGPQARDTGFADFDFWNSYRGAPGAFRLYDDDGRSYIPTTGLDTAQTSGAFLGAYLDEKLETGDPFYVYDAFFSPHKQTVHHDLASLPYVSPRHANSPVPPFRFAPEGEDSDKLPGFQGARFSRAYYQRLFTARARALYDVDDQMAAVFERLEDAGVLDHTTVLFASDNGYTDRGQDNWEGKSIPYPAATNIPMLAYYPGRAPAVDGRPVALVDLAPTLYDVFDTEPGHVVDGHSLLSDYRRDYVYAEFYNENSAPSRHESGPLVSHLHSWRAVKRGRVAYVEWYGKDREVIFRELYADPAMTKNLLAPVHADQRPSRAIVRAFQQLLRRFGSCAGTVAQGSRSPCP